MHYYQDVLLYVLLFSSTYVTHCLYVSVCRVTTDTEVILLVKMRLILPDVECMIPVP